MEGVEANICQTSSGRIGDSRNSRHIELDRMRTSSPWWAVGTGRSPSGDLQAQSRDITSGSPVTSYAWMQSEFAAMEAS